MFEGLQDRLGAALKKARGHGKLTEGNIDESIREVRLALLEADVNVTVVKDFLGRVKEKSLGEAVMRSITPGQQFTKIIHDELVETLGGRASELVFKGSPAVVMLCGLQGSGKTTTVAKLARLLKSKGRNPYLVPADLARPAAVKQLLTLAADIGVDCYDSTRASGDVAGSPPDLSPVDVCKEALRVASAKNYDTMIVDTAGRLHVDGELMDELRAVRDILKPIETLFVADAMTGQDAVNSATSFNEEIGVTGIVLTKLDGDARGGAALSMRMVTGRPIKFAGTGEKIEDFDAFHPDRLAGRILGMGDVMTLVEKAQDVIDEKDARALEKKIRKDGFSLQDFLDQLRQIKKLGPLEGLLSMMPGFDAMKKQKGFSVDEKEFTRTEAIICSMTLKERANPVILNAKRRIRVARGSGTKVQDVNRLMKQFGQMSKMMKKMRKKGGGLDPAAFLGGDGGGGGRSGGGMGGMPF